MAVAPNAKTLYVTDDSGGDGPDGFLVPVSTASHQVGRRVRVGEDPVSVAITPNGSTVYVANVASNTVTAINTTTDTAVKSIPAGKTPAALAVTPNGKTVYATIGSSDTVVPISTATNTPGKSIEVSPVKNYNNTAIALSPDGKTLYTSGYTGGGSLNSPGYVIPIATGTGTVGQPIKVAQSPTALGITPNGAVAYVLCSGPVEKSAGEVIPIDTATGKAGPPVSRGGYPTSIVFVP